MSRAFVKEPDGLSDFEDLPDKLISEHANLVTREGLAAIEAEVQRLQTARADAQTVNDRGAISRTGRDLRYWSQRLASAELVSTPTAFDTVQFGATVGILRSDGRRQEFRIVGEDQADPSNGTLSYASPLAQALLGKRVGDHVKAGAGDVEVISIA